jgi:hypothetical protein
MLGPICSPAETLFSLTTLITSPFTPFLYTPQTLAIITPLILTEFDVPTIIFVLQGKRTIVIPKTSNFRGRTLSPTMNKVIEEYQTKNGQ